ncbi:MAG: helix-turn-helix domain-containing protein [Propionibacteriaceae bacterium]|jgi:excisionase family DNA binding protein|nr:helix-turn-helix domain-containing protein [Propionibacteriaceae bacterium]
MVAHALATLDPNDPAVRAEAGRLATRLSADSGRDTTVSRVVRAMLDNITQGERVTVLRQDQELTPSQAAAMMGVTRQFVDRLMADGVLAFQRLPGSKHRRVKAADVLALAAERERRQAGHAALRDAFADAGLLDNA